MIVSTTILLIRHGQTDWNATGRWQGHQDVPLNETGEQQALALAKRLRAWPITTVYTSDLSRARATATAVGQVLNIDPQVDSDWRERSLGKLEGMTRREVQLYFPQVYVPQNFVDAPDGETYETLRTRVLRAFARVASLHADETTAVVTHGGTIRIIVSHILCLPDRFYAPFSLRGNTGITRIEVGENGLAQITLLNDTSHLEQVPEQALSE